MKIQFLGTGAADWPFEKSPEAKEFRRLSAAIIDWELLIDCGPQTIGALQEYRIDPAGIRYILITHRHFDHFSLETVRELEKCGAHVIELRAGETKTLGKYTVRAYAGNHGTCTNTLHYIISDGRNTVFYGLDGAWLLYEEVQAIKEYRPDLAVLDATIGFVDGDYRIFEHNSLNMILEMKRSLSDYVKQFCISHMARTLHTDHIALQKSMEKEDVLTAYDGMEIELI